MAPVTILRNKNGASTGHSYTDAGSGAFGRRLRSPDGGPYVPADAAVQGNSKEENRDGQGDVGARQPQTAAMGAAISGTAHKEALPPMRWSPMDCPRFPKAPQRLWPRLPPDGNRLRRARRLTRNASTMP